MIVKKTYDYLIVGTGLFGSIFAYEANKLGKKCLVIDKRNHIGGYTQIIEHEHFEYDIQPKKMIIREYPAKLNKGNKPYYSINNKKIVRFITNIMNVEIKNIMLYSGRRLRMYKYFDMHNVVLEALKCVNIQLKVEGKNEISNFRTI